MGSHWLPLEVIALRVAGLELWLDARTDGIRMTVPLCHGQFLICGEPQGGLMLQVRDGPTRSTDSWHSLFYDAESWKLWLDDAGRYVLGTPTHSPPQRQVTVDAAYRSGEVTGEFSASGEPGMAVYPLMDIDIILFSNWLAESGDLIVHAGGVDHHEAGYAFVGPAGAGKSTLIAELVSGSSVTVLGEDQVILRLREGQWWIYGTPWHTNPARCSPGGVPLRKVFFLDRTVGHCVRPCGRMAAMTLLMQDAFIPYYNRAGTERILDNLAHLVERVPLFTLGFQIGADAMELIGAARQGN